jgi:hypothetical protein
MYLVMVDFQWCVSDTLAQVESIHVHNYVACEVLVLLDFTEYGMNIVNNIHA